MRTIVRVLFLATITALFTSACSIHTKDSIIASKNYISKNVKVESFSGLKSEIVGNITYTQSPTSSVEIYGPDNIVALINVEVNHNTLVITMKDKKKIRKAEKLKIMVSSPSLSQITSKGVGDITLEGNINSETLDITQEGVGDIVANSLNYKNIKVVSKGVGDVKLGGTSNNTEYNLYGVGDINAYNLKSDYVKAHLKGVGNLHCYAIQSIDAESKGVGNIKFKGKPGARNLSKKGVGKIREVN